MCVCVCVCVCLSIKLVVRVVHSVGGMSLRPTVREPNRAHVHAHALTRVLSIAAKAGNVPGRAFSSVLAYLHVRDNAGYTFMVALPAATESQAMDVVAHVAYYLYGNQGEYGVQEGSDVRLAGPDGNMVTFRFPTNDAYETPHMPRRSAANLRAEFARNGWRMLRVYGEHPNAQMRNARFFNVNIATSRDIVHRGHGGKYFDQVYAAFPPVQRTVTNAVTFAVSTVFATVVEQRGDFEYDERDGRAPIPVKTSGPTFVRASS